MYGRVRRTSQLYPQVTAIVATVVLAEIMVIAAASVPESPSASRRKGRRSSLPCG